MAGSKAVIDFITDEISIDTYLNVMDQYRPAFQANIYPELNRRITPSEYKEVVDYAFNKGLRRGFDATQ
jgi:putative pyruvate formate lyase activating enzyme